MWLDIYKVKRKIRLFTSLHTVLKKHDSILLEKKVFSSQKYTYMRKNFFNFIQFQEALPDFVYNTTNRGVNQTAHIFSYIKKTPIFKISREELAFKRSRPSFFSKLHIANNNNGFFMPFYLNDYLYSVVKFTDFIKNVKLPYYLILDVIDEKAGGLDLEILQDASEKIYNFASIAQKSEFSKFVKGNSSVEKKNNKGVQFIKIPPFFNSFPFFLYYPTKKFFALKTRRTFKLYDKPFFFLYDKEFNKISKFIRGNKKKNKNFIL